MKIKQLKYMYLNNNLFVKFVIKIIKARDQYPWKVMKYPMMVGDPGFCPISSTAGYLDHQTIERSWKPHM